MLYMLQQLKTKTHCQVGRMITSTQGCPLSPWLFNVFIDKIVSEARKQFQGSVRLSTVATVKDPNTLSNWQNDYKYTL